MDKIKNNEEVDLNDNYEEISDNELENSIAVLQNAINIVKSQRKQTEQETQIIYKRISHSIFLLILKNFSLFLFNP